MQSEPQPTAAEKVFGDLRGQSVLVIGIGGGGDIIGSVAVYRELQRHGIHPLLGGLTWKRSVHDFAARPRSIKEFANIAPIDENLGWVGPTTFIKDSEIKHVEADVAEITGSSVLAIDISNGSASIRQSIKKLMAAKNLTTVVAVDVGGDVLCKGDEPTIRSPLCDHIMLKAISCIDNAILTVVGLGADGELTLDSFAKRFKELLLRDAFLGALAVNPQDLSEIQRMLASGKSECSRLVCQVASQLSSKELLQMESKLNSVESDDWRDLINVTDHISLRAGLRQGELSGLTAMMLCFRADEVCRTSQLSALVHDSNNLKQVTKSFRDAGIVTEFDE